MWRPRGTSPNLLEKLRKLHEQSSVLEVKPAVALESISFGTEVAGLVVFV